MILTFGTFSCTIPPPRMQCVVSSDDFRRKRDRAIRLYRHERESLCSCCLFAVRSSEFGKESAAFKNAKKRKKQTRIGGCDLTNKCRAHAAQGTPRRALTHNSNSLRQLNRVDVVRAFLAGVHGPVAPDVAERFGNTGLLVARVMGSSCFFWCCRTAGTVIVTFCRN